MKKINSILLLVIGLLIVSCGTRHLYMSSEEAAEKDYSMDGWSILKAGKVVGTLTGTEWEIYKRSVYREISVETSFSSDEEMKEIGRFVHSKFPNSKIEINEDGGNSFPKPQN